MANFFARRFSLQRNFKDSLFRRWLLEMKLMYDYLVIQFSPLPFFRFLKMKKQGNRGVMRKIHVIRWFFESSGRHGDLIEKTKKNPFSDKVNGSMCAKFEVCIVFRLARRRDANE